MLRPETRTLLSDALRPPLGFQVDLAVATTYSLDLTAMLLAPMTFALHDDDVSDLDTVDPIKLLEAVRRYADLTTVFAQAGAIAVPSSYRRILTFAEECVHEVSSPRGLFHPKTWTIRFSDGEGAFLHRLLCLSRNLTFDRSWDTVLVLDQAESSEAATASAGPLVAFLRELPGLCVRPLPTQRAQDLKSLEGTLAGVRFAAPPDFTAVSLLPLGFSWSEPFPQPSGGRAAVISPFLDVTTARKLQTLSTATVLLTRPETADRLGAAALDQAEVHVLQRAAEIEIGADPGEPETAAFEHPVAEGLHAKTYVFEDGKQTTVVTGSANATQAGTKRNVEFEVVLTGPTAKVGVDSMWEGTDEAPGLVRLCQRYSPAEDAEGAADNEEMTREVEAFHAELARGVITATVSTTGDGRYSLELALPDLPSPGTTTVWPVTTPQATWSRRLGRDELRWAPLGLATITPFYVVSTTAGIGTARCTVTCVLTADLIGDPPERRRDALGDILQNQADVLRYLAFLLGDPTLISGATADSGEGWMFGDLPSGSRQDIVLFEPLIRAMAQGSSALGRVRALYDDLVLLPNGNELLPEGWDALWQAVWTAHSTRLGANA
jgi:hypothetical protein